MRVLSTISVVQSSFQQSWQTLSSPDQVECLFIGENLSRLLVLFQAVQVFFLSEYENPTRQLSLVQAVKFLT